MKVGSGKQRKRRDLIGEIEYPYDGRLMDLDKFVEELMEMKAKGANKISFGAYDSNIYVDIDKFALELTNERDETEEEYQARMIKRQELKIKRKEREVEMALRDIERMNKKVDKLNKEINIEKLKGKI